jgi:hypothetical protein
MMQVGVRPRIPLGTGSSASDPVNRSMSSTVAYSVLSFCQLAAEISRGRFAQLRGVFPVQSFLGSIFLFHFSRNLWT